MLRDETKEWLPHRHVFDQPNVRAMHGRDERTLDRLIQDCADQASGVRDVENRIRVASQGSRTEPEQPSLTGGGKTSLSH